MPSEDVLAVTLEVTEALEELGVAYVVVGSLASSMHGLPRSTRDVDLVAAIEEQHAQPLVARLQEHFYVDAGMISRAIRNCSAFNVIHLASMFKVDVFVPDDDAASREQLARSQKLELPQMPGRFIAVAGPEDTIVQKLAWFRKGDEVSERQWQDVLGVIKVKREQLDLEYLRKWATELGVSDLLEKALEA
jgi:hypothetical protein